MLVYTHIIIARFSVAPFVDSLYSSTHFRNYEPRCFAAQYIQETLEYIQETLEYSCGSELTNERSE